MILLSLTLTIAPRITEATCVYGRNMEVCGDADPDSQSYSAHNPRDRAALHARGLKIVARDVADPDHFVHSVAENRTVERQVRVVFALLLPDGLSLTMRCVKQLF